jgi:hypothetical protein
VELSLGVGLTLLDELGAVVAPADGRLDRDWMSRRRAAIRSTMDCRALEFRSEILGNALSAIGLGDAPAPIRLPMLLVASGLTLLREGGSTRSLDGLLLWEPIGPPKERLFREGVELDSGARTDGRDGVVVNDRFWLGGLERNDGAGRLGLTEVLGRLGLMDGLDRPIRGLGLTDGLGRLNDVFGRLGLIDGLGLGATDLDRVDMRFCRPPPEKLDRGADWTIGDGPRLTCGLGADRNDDEPIDPPRFITDGLEGVCGEACTLGAEFLALIREPRSLRRDCPEASPTGSIIPTTTAATNKPETRFLTFQGPAARLWSFSL